MQRVSSRFAVLETALQLATHLTQWTETDNSEALIRCFNNWLAEFGTGEREEVKIVEFFTDWLAENAEGLFIPIPRGENDRQLLKNYGYRILEVKGISKEHFYIYPTSFNRLISESGFPKNMVFEKLATNKITEQGSEKEERKRYLHKPKKRLVDLGVPQNKRFVVLHPWGIDEE